MLVMKKNYSGVKYYLSSVMAARKSPKLLVGVQVPAGMPNIKLYETT